MCFSLTATTSILSTKKSFAPHCRKLHSKILTSWVTAKIQFGKQTWVIDLDMVEIHGRAGTKYFNSTL